MLTVVIVVLVGGGGDTTLSADHRLVSAPEHCLKIENGKVSILVGRARSKANVRVGTGPSEAPTLECLQPLSDGTGSSEIDAV